MQLKRYFIPSERRSVEYAVHYGNTVILGCVPQKSRGRAFVYKTVARKIIYILRRRLFPARKVYKAALMGVRGIGGYNRVAKQRGVNRLAFGENLPHLFAVIRGCIVRR